MNYETIQILSTVKQLLKIKGIKYADLAKELGISLPSVKRILNSDDIQISKISQIAAVIGVDFFELIEQAQKKNQKKFKFTQQQEDLLAKDFHYFLVFRSLVMNISLEDIRLSLGLSQQKVEKILHQLARIELIEIYPDQKIKMKAHFPFEWREAGPLEKTYHSIITTKMASEIKRVGINKYHSQTQTRTHTKELLLHANEAIDLQEKIDEIISSYNTLTKVRLKSHHQFKIFSFSSLSGFFSWWD